MREVGDRPAFVRWCDAEQFRHPLGEALDAQAGIEEQRAEIGGGHQILQIAVGARNGFQLQLQFAVDSLQFFVDRLELFLAGFELFGRRSIFLVDRLQFLIAALSSSLAASDSSRTVFKRACVSSSSCVRRRTVSSVAWPSVFARFSSISSPSMNITTAFRASPISSVSAVFT